MRMSVKALYALVSLSWLAGYLAGIQGFCGMAYFVLGLLLVSVAMLFLKYLWEN